MDLILWRHAEARDAAEGEDDLARPLTPRGEKQARRMADWLGEVLPESTRVLVSPALRTRQTAAALDRKTRICAELAPGAGVDTLLAAVRWPTRREPVLVVGHQPQLGQAAAWLLGGAAALDGQGWTIRKGAIWWLRQREREGRSEVLLVAVRSATGFGT
jgi:phosphohistidine phosphatase